MGDMDDWEERVMAKLGDSVIYRMYDQSGQEVDRAAIVTGTHDDSDAVSLTVFEPGVPGASPLLNVPYSPNEVLVGCWRPRESE